MADYTQTPANVLASAAAVRVIPFGNVHIAGEEIEAGQPVYFGTDNKWYRADANAADPAYKAEAIAENHARAGQPVSLIKEDPGFKPGLTSLAIGDTLIVSSNPGKICPDSDKAANWRVSILGVAWSTTEVNLKITRADVPIA